MELSKFQLVNTFLIVIITIISLFQLSTINKIEDQIEKLRKIDLPLLETEIKIIRKKLCQNLIVVKKIIRQNLIVVKRIQLEVHKFIHKII